MILHKLVVIASCVLIGSCTGIPEGVHPVEGFDINRYLGKWYEIARLDHSFERGMNNVSAEYSLREDGGVRVINRGYLKVKQKWKQAEGRAYFVGDENQGYLKVSFFGPFYASYVVFELERDNYQYAFISGNSRDYLWLLARSPKVDKEILEKFTAQAGKLGFATEDLIFVNHDLPGSGAGK